MKQLLTEIDDRCAGASPPRISRMVLTLLAQYIAQAPLCSADQLELYDQALLALVKRLPAAGMSDVSHRLARSEASPAATLVFLAENTDIEIAGPVLLHARLPDKTIAGIVSTRRGPHLMAIASRRTVSSDICIALVESGIPAVVGQTVKNQGAILSEMVFSLLIGMAAKDRELARLIALRTDVPEELRSFIDMILQ